MRPALRNALWLLLALLIATGAVAVRRHVFNAQRALTPDGDVPFTLESALAYRRIQLAYRDGALPSLDRAVGWPAGIDTRATDSSGAELALAAAARAWPGTLPLADKIRWLELLWFCTVSVAGLFCLVRWAGGGWAGGAIAAAFWAVAISAVARSTGQELSHENDALPLVIWSLAFMARLWNRPRSSALSGWLSALLMTAALCLWDLVQYAIGLAALAHLLPALAGHLDRRRGPGALPPAAALHNWSARQHGRPHRSEYRGAPEAVGAEVVGIQDEGKRTGKVAFHHPIKFVADGFGELTQHTEVVEDEREVGLLLTDTLDLADALKSFWAMDVAT